MHSQWYWIIPLVVLLAVLNYQKVGLAVLLLFIGLGWVFSNLGKVFIFLVTLPFRLIWWVITLPFNLIWWLVDNLFGQNARRIFYLAFYENKILSGNFGVKIAKVLTLATFVGLLVYHFKR